jgi:hypothetical protein
MQLKLTSFNNNSKLNPLASDFIEWVTPKPIKPAPYKPGQEIKKIEIHTVKTCLDYLEDFKISPRVKEHTNYYFPVLFRGLKCQIHVPVMMELFGLLNYKDPSRNGSSTENKPKYSIHLCMDDSTNEIYNFHCLIDYLDKIAQQHISSLSEQDLGFKFNDKRFHQFSFYSALRENRKDKSKPLGLRIKVPCQDNLMGCDLYNGEELLSKDLETFQKYVKHGTYMKCIIEVNPIWYGTYTGDNKYGISYKLIALRIERPKIEFEKI